MFVKWENKTWGSFIYDALILPGSFEPLPLFVLPPPYTSASLASHRYKQANCLRFLCDARCGDKFCVTRRADVLPLTKSCPRLRGKWHGVAMTKGERLEAAKLFYYSPSGNPPKLSPGWNKVALLTFVRNSPCSCPFSVSLHPPQAALNSEPRKRWRLYAAGIT